MLGKILIPIFIILLVGMVAFIFWPTKIESFKSALSKSQEVVCEYIDADGLQTKTYIKAGMLRSNFVDKKVDQNSGGLLIKDGKTYVWWTQDKRGVVASSVDDNSEQQNQVISDMEKYKKFCKTGTVSDNLFIVPSDIQFRDFLKNPTSSSVPAL